LKFHVEQGSGEAKASCKASPLWETNFYVELASSEANRALLCEAISERS